MPKPIYDPGWSVAEQLEAMFKAGLSEEEIVSQHFDMTEPESILCDLLILLRRAWAASKTKIQCPKCNNSDLEQITYVGKMHVWWEIYGLRDNTLNVVGGFENDGNCIDLGLHCNLCSTQFAVPEGIKVEHD